MYIGNNAKMLSTIDLYSGYHQIPMAEEDKEKTSFTTVFRNCNFRVMQFGLCNAPASFQREMNRIFDLIGVCLYILTNNFFTIVRIRPSSSPVSLFYIIK